jgi:DNA-binding MarR family transcriptional regulator
MEQKPLMLMVRQLDRAWRERLRKISAEAGIPDPYARILAYLHRNPGASQKDLAEHTQKTYAAISQTVKEMLREEYVRRETDSEDQRCAKLYLTEKGRNCSLQLRTEIGKAEERVRMALPAGKEEEIATLLGQLYEAVRKEQ